MMAPTWRPAPGGLAQAALEALEVAHRARLGAWAALGSPAAQEALGRPVLAAQEAPT